MIPLCRKLVISAVTCLALISLHSAAIAGAPKCRWVETEGRADADGNVTVEDARRIALDRARYAAIKQVVGVSIFSNTTVKDNILVNDFIQSGTEGMIVKERKPVWSTEMYTPAPGKLGVPSYTVKLSSCVSVDTSDRDPGFRVNLTISKPVYLSGEEVTLTVHSTRDSFLSLFHIDKDD